MIGWLFNFALNIFTNKIRESSRDGQINPVDLNANWRNENGNPFDYYDSKSDFNLDGYINPVDKNNYWRTNNSKIEELE